MSIISEFNKEFRIDVSCDASDEKGINTYLMDEVKKGLS